jgi:enoyl-CoA hydratase
MTQATASATADYGHITYEVVQGRARITLNRPEKRNALSNLALKELHHALWRADEDNRVHCVILAGAGKDFCAGYDLHHYEGAEAGSVEQKRGHQSFEDDVWQLERTLEQRMPLFDIHKPTIAQVHGNCLAGGTDLALLCDMVICADDAKFGFPALRSQGSPPNHMWLYHLGPQWAKRLLLTGDSLLGADAAALGLAMKSVPASHLAAEVDALADRQAHIDTDLLAANKRIVNIGLELMGARTMQRLAAEMDARAHLAKSRDLFRQHATEHGLKHAVKMRDEPFGDGIVRR